MKKLLLISMITLFAATISTAQTNYLPNFQIGVKAGGDFSLYAGSQDVHNAGKAGIILAGAWARLGGAGLFFQPEVYGTIRNVNISQSSDGYAFVNKAKFTTADIPLLVGEKTGDANAGFRFYTGPALLLSLAKVQDFYHGNIYTRLNFNDINYAWQFGAGADIKDFSFDIRYEEGLDKVGYGPVNKKTTRMNLVSFTVAYSIFSSYN